MSVSGRAAAHADQRALGHEQIPLYQLVDHALDGAVRHLSGIARRKQVLEVVHLPRLVAEQDHVVV